MLQSGGSTRYEAVPSEQSVTHDSFKRRLGKCKCSNCIADISGVDDEHSSDSSYGVAIGESVNSVSKEEEAGFTELEVIARQSSADSNVTSSSATLNQCQDLDETRLQLDVCVSEIRDSRLLFKDAYDNNNYVHSTDCDSMNVRLELSPTDGPLNVLGEANTALSVKCPTLTSLLKKVKSVPLPVDPTIQQEDMYPQFGPNGAGTPQVAPRTMQRVKTPVYYRVPETWPRTPSNQPIGKSGGPCVMTVSDRGGFVPSGQFVPLPDHRVPVNPNYSWTHVQTIDHGVRPYHTAIAPVVQMGYAPRVPYLAPNHMSPQEQPLDLSVSKTRKFTQAQKTDGCVDNKRVDRSKQEHVYHNSIPSDQNCIVQNTCPPSGWIQLSNPVNVTNNGMPLSGQPLQRPTYVYHSTSPDINSRSKTILAKVEESIRREQQSGPTGPTVAVPRFPLGKPCTEYLQTPVVYVPVPSSSSAQLSKTHGYPLQSMSLQNTKRTLDIAMPVKSMFVPANSNLTPVVAKTNSAPTVWNTTTLSNGAIQMGVPVSCPCTGDMIANTASAQVAAGGSNLPAFAKNTSSPEFVCAMVPVSSLVTVLTTNSSPAITTVSKAMPMKAPPPTSQDVLLTTSSSSSSPCPTSTSIRPLVPTATTTTTASSPQLLPKHGPDRVPTIPSRFVVPKHSLPSTTELLSNPPTTTALSPQLLPNHGPDRVQTIPSRSVVPRHSLPSTTELLSSPPAKPDNHNAQLNVPLPVMRHSNGDNELHHSISPSTVSAHDGIQTSSPATAAAVQSICDQDDLPALIEVGVTDQQVSTVLNNSKQLPADRNCQATEVTSYDNNLQSVFLPPTPPAEEREQHTLAAVDNAVFGHQQFLSSVGKVTEPEGGIRELLMFRPSPENPTDSVHSRSESTASKVGEIDMAACSVTTAKQLNSSRKEVVDDGMSHVESVQADVAMSVPVCEQSVESTHKSETESVEHDVSTAGLLPLSSKEDRDLSTSFTAPSHREVDCQLETSSQPSVREKLVVKLKKTKIKNGKRRSSYEVQIPQQIEALSDNDQHDDIKTIGYNEDAMSTVVLRSLDDQYRQARAKAFKDVAPVSPVLDKSVFGSQETLCYAGASDLDEADNHDAGLVTVKEESSPVESHCLTVEDDGCELDSAGQALFGSQETQVNTDDDHALKEMGDSEEVSLNVAEVQILEDSERAPAENETCELPLDDPCFGACIKMEPFATDTSSADAETSDMIPESVIREQTNDAFSSVSFSAETETAVCVPEVEERTRELNNGVSHEAPYDFERSQIDTEEGACPVDHDMPKIVWFGSLSDKAVDCNRDMVRQICESYDNLDLDATIGCSAPDEDLLQRTSDTEKVEEFSVDVNLNKDESGPSSPEIRNISNSSNDMPVLEKYEIQDLHETVRENPQKENNSEQDELVSVQDRVVIDEPTPEKFDIDDILDDIRKKLSASEIEENNDTSYLSDVTSFSDDADLTLNGNDCGKGISSEAGTEDRIVDKVDVAVDSEKYKVTPVHDTPSLSADVCSRKIKDKFRILKHRYQRKTTRPDSVNNKRLRMSELKPSNRNIWDLIKWEDGAAKTEVNSVETKETTTTALFSDANDSKLRPTALVKPTFTKTVKTSPVVCADVKSDIVLAEKLSVSRKSKGKLYKGFKFMSVRLKRATLPVHCSSLIVLGKKKRGRPRKYPAVNHEANSNIVGRCSSAPALLPPSGKKRGRPRKSVPVNRTNNGHQADPRAVLQTCADRVKLLKRGTKTNPMMQKLRRRRKWLKHGSLSSLQQEKEYRPDPLISDGKSHKAENKPMQQTQKKDQSKQREFSSSSSKKDYSNIDLSKDEASKKTEVPCSLDQSTSTKTKNGIRSLPENARDGSRCKGQITDVSCSSTAAGSKSEHFRERNVEPGKTRKLKRKLDQDSSEAECVKVKRRKNVVDEKHPERTPKKGKIEADENHSERSQKKKEKKVDDENHPKHTPKKGKIEAGKNHSERSQKKKEKKVDDENHPERTPKKGKIEAGENHSERSQKKKDETEVDGNNSERPQKKKSVVVENRSDRPQEKEKKKELDENHLERSQRKKKKAVVDEKQLECPTKNTKVVINKNDSERPQKSKKDEVDEIHLKRSHKKKKKEVVEEKSKKEGADGNPLKRSHKKKKNVVSENNSDHQEKKKTKKEIVHENELERHQKNKKLVIDKKHSEGFLKGRKIEVGETVSERPRKKRKAVHENHSESPLKKTKEVVEENDSERLQKNGEELVDGNHLERSPKKKNKKKVVNENLSNLPQKNGSELVKENHSERPQKNLKGVVGENHSEGLQKKRNEAVGENHSKHSQKKKKKEVVSENYSEVPQRKSKHSLGKQTPSAAKHSTKVKVSNQPIIYCNSLSPGKYCAVQSDGQPMKALKASEYNHSRDGPLVQKFVVKHLFSESPCAVACIKLHKQNHTTVSLLSRSLSGDPRDVSHAVVDVVLKSDIRRELVSATDAALFWALHGVDDKELVNLSDVFKLFTYSQLDDLTHWERWKRLTGISQPFITRDKTKHFVSLRQIHEKLFSVSTTFGSLDRALRIFSFVTHSASKRELRHFEDQSPAPSSGVCKIVCVNGLVDKLELIKKYLTNQTFG